LASGVAQAAIRRRKKRQMGWSRMFCIRSG